MSDEARDREAFEREAQTTHNLAIERDEYGRYRNYTTGVGWELWQVALAYRDREIRDAIITDRTTCAADYSDAEEYADRILGRPLPHPPEGKEPTR